MFGSTLAVLPDSLRANPENVGKGRASGFLRAEIANNKKGCGNILSAPGEIHRRSQIKYRIFREKLNLSPSVAAA